MPSFSNNSSPRRGGAGAPRGSKPGSASPKHRGYRPEAGAPGKNRWSNDDRAARGRPESSDRGERRPDWTPPEARPRRAGESAGQERRARQGQNERFGDRERNQAARDDRYSSGRNSSASRDDRYSRNERPQRDDRAPRGDRPYSNDRTDRAPRGDRPYSNDRSDRAPRGDRPYSNDRTDRAPRGDRPFTNDRNDRAPRGDRPYSNDRTDRAPRGDRPFTNDRNDRAPRGDRPFTSDRNDRAPRGDRPFTNDRNDRAPRDDRFSRGERPQRDDRAPRGDRPYSNDRSERAPRGDRSARAYEPGVRPTRDGRPVRDERPARDFDRAPRQNRPEGGRFERPRAAEGRSVSYGESEFYGRPNRDMGNIEDVVLDRLAATATVAAEVEGVTFGDLGLGTNIVRVLGELGAASPFPIQAATIPDVLNGLNVLGRGRTGSGKTIAFGAPLVERLMENGGGAKRTMGRAPRALILAPTRELALQIDRTVQPIARSVGLFTTQIYGGVPQARQVGALNRGVDIIIGTPGRIEDLVEQGHLDLSEVSVVVLDEADHMCDLGFLEPVQRILRLTRPDAQRLLFSATLDSGVASLVDEFLPNPSVHEVAGEDQSNSNIDHRLLLIDQGDKVALVAELAAGRGKTLVFARTRAFAEQLADELSDLGVPATSLHGDLNQARRTRSLERLTSGAVDVLVATDVAARGIHVDDIGLVIQADMPEEYKTYLHRAGRTGRAGHSGIVVTLIGKNRRRKMEELLSRAEIKAVTTTVAPGDKTIRDLVAR